MKFLKQEENKHFYYSGKGNLFCTNSENCIAHIKDESELKDKEIDKVTFYSSGALLKTKTEETLEYLFVQNNAERTFSLYVDNWNEKECPFYEIKPYVCGTGILVAYQCFSGETNYTYHTYTGMLIKDKDFDSIIKRIDKYEDRIGVCFNDVNETKEVIKLVKKDCEKLKSKNKTR